MASSESRTVIFAALIGNGLIAITKFVASVMTGSSAMFTEGIHSAVDTGNQVLLLYGLNRSKKPPSEQFPFGHGKEIYFWSFVVAILIFAVGAGISIYEGIEAIRHPHPISDPTVNYIVLGLAIVFEGAAWIFAFRAFTKAKGKWGYIEAVQRGKDPSLFVVLFEDSAAALGLIVAFAGILLSQVTGDYRFDGIASVIIGLILGGTAAWLAHETKGLLIGESANKVVVNGVRAMVNKMPEVEKVNEILTMHMGPEFILVNISVEFGDHFKTTNLEKAIAHVDAAIKEEFPAVKRVFVEAETVDPNADAAQPEVAG